MRDTFQEELAELESLLQEEGSLVSKAIWSAINALKRRDLELADELIAFDDQIDGLYLRIELGIRSLLARQTPVASDLRLVLACLHMNLHLERMGDYCVTIAKLTKLIHELEPDVPVVEALEEMAARADEMLHAAIESFRSRDLPLAQRLSEMDELIDRANRRLVRRIIELGGDEDVREWGMRIMLVSRCLERIGDHAVDIGEQVAYLVTGEFAEFTDASHPVGEATAS
ncbi:MAG: phosphate transport system protein [Gaiellaceae bacterium]|jgi:phosphate transport system protein|nr:phosphate transport system protein [Gaiellaceae bacterium]